MGFRRLAPLMALALAAAACGDDAEQDATVKRAEVLTAAILDVVGIDPTTTEEIETVPVVYVVSVAEEGIAAGAQADVASALRDEVDVRFADAREEAIEGSEEGAPVPDDGTLLLIGLIPESGYVIEVPIEVYRDENDWTKAVFTLRSTGDGWEVTTTSQVPLDAVGT